MRRAHTPARMMARAIVLWALVLGLMFWLPDATRTRAASAAAESAGMDVLVIEHTPLGVVERSGRVVAWRAVGGSMLLEFVDDGDAIFRNGFEEVSACP